MSLWKKKQHKAENLVAFYWHLHPNRTTGADPRKRGGPRTHTAASSPQGRRHSPHWALLRLAARLAAATRSVPAAATTPSPWRTARWSSADRRCRPSRREQGTWSGRGQRSPGRRRRRPRTPPWPGRTRRRGRRGWPPAGTRRPAPWWRTWRTASARRRATATAAGTGSGSWTAGRCPHPRRRRCLPRPPAGRAWRSPRPRGPRRRPPASTPTGTPPPPPSPARPGGRGKIGFRAAAS